MQLVKWWSQDANRGILILELLLSPSVLPSEQSVMKPELLSTCSRKESRNSAPQVNLCQLQMKATLYELL